MINLNLEEILNDNIKNYIDKVVTDEIDNKVKELKERLYNNKEEYVCKIMSSIKINFKKDLSMLKPNIIINVINEETD